MRIVVTGSSGLVGSALVPALRAKGNDVARLVRRAPASHDEIRWNAAGPLPPEALRGADAVVHLAGESIAGKRWNAATKEAIRSSRVETTKRLAEGILGLDPRPRVFVGASAIGVYGSRGDEVLVESSAPGDDFLAEVCRAWEEAAAPLARAGVRVVHLRFGVILSARGGALQKMLTPFRLGVGGVVGSGRQWMSWISLDDAVAAILFALGRESFAGAANAVAPSAVTNREFTKTLGRVLSRPTVFPMPAFAARLAFGEMADALLLSSARVRPAALEAAGFRFSHPRLEDALRHVLAAP